MGSVYSSLQQLKGLTSPCMLTRNLLMVYLIYKEAKFIQRNLVGIHSFILRGRLQNSSVLTSPFLLWKGFHHGIPRSLIVCLASSVLSSNVPTIIATVGGDEKSVFNMSLNCKISKNTCYSATVSEVMKLILITLIHKV